MKRPLLIISTSFALMQGAYSQTEKAHHNRTDLILTQSDTLQLVSDIEMVKQEIKNNTNSYQRIVKYKDDSGYKIVYVKDQEVKLMWVYSKENDVSKEVELYFSEGQLVYSEQIWTDTKTNKKINTEKFYLNNDHLIIWTKEGTPVNRNSVEFKKAENDLVETAAKVKANK